MPIWVNSTILDIGYKCSRCGESGNEQVDAMETQSCAIEVYTFTCPNCGADLYADYDEWEEEEEE